MSQKLYEMLKDYAASDFYPWHMPGHKRRLVEFENPFSMDITEIDGFDDLHHPEGILKEAMENAAGIYGSEKSYFLVNGSSCGILAAVSAAVKPGGKLLLARNCHKSAYHGALLQQAQVTYLYPRLEAEGFYGAVQAADVEEALKADPEIEAVMIVSPGYEGVVSDIKAISQAAHAHGCALLVDEAHGAHFPFRNKAIHHNKAYSSGIHSNKVLSNEVLSNVIHSNEALSNEILNNEVLSKEADIKLQKTLQFPSSALENGADIVIQSLHKTLPSLTQTAILHVGRNVNQGMGQGSSSRINVELLELYLRIYQSSSPSYIFMASIDHCIRLMAGEQGQQLMEIYAENLYRTRRELRENLKVLRLYNPTENDGKVNVQNQAECFYDPSKFVVLGNGSMDGSKLADTLRSQYHLEPEMNTDHYVILMSSPADTKEGFERMTKALLEIDRKLAADMKCLNKNLNNAEASKHHDHLNCSEGSKYEDDANDSVWVNLPTKAPKTVMKIHQATTASGQWVSLEQALNQTCHDFIYIYPPGIPLLVPGEQIEEKHLDIIKTYQAHDLEVHGIQNGKIRCVKQID